MTRALPAAVVAVVAVVAVAVAVAACAPNGGAPATSARRTSPASDASSAARRSPPVTAKSNPALRAESIASTVGVAVPERTPVEVLTAPLDGIGEGVATTGAGNGSVDGGDGVADAGVVDAGDGGVEQGAPVFVAVGYGGRRATSSDGFTWDNDVADVVGGGDDDNLLRDVCAGRDNSGGRVIFAVGGSHIGRVMRSVDGVTWSSHVDQAGWLGGCAVGDGLVVAVGSDRSTRSLDFGVTWGDDAVHFAGDNPWQMRDAAFGQHTFVAVGDAGIFSSSDGVQWTARDAHRLEHVAAGSNGFVAVGGGVRGFSSDGTSWTFTNAAANDVAWDGTRYVVVGNFTAQFSSDGVTWDTRAIAPALDLVAAGDGRYLSSTWPDARRTSSDALAWSAPTSDGNAIAALVFAR